MDNKNIVKSQTVWGAVLAFLGPVLTLFGVELGVGLEQDVAIAIGSVVTAFGAVWVLVERFKRGDLWIVKKPSG